MLWAGGLSVPLVLLWTVAGYESSIGTPVIMANAGLRLILGFSFAAIVATSYEVIFYKKLKIVPHPHRSKLAQLVLGPVVFLSLALIFQKFVVVFLLLGFVAELSVLIYHQKKLLWEAVVSGLLMAIIYIVVFVIISSLAPDSGLSLLVHGFSGIDILGIPVEELLFVFGYGLLWGPLYEGMKRRQL
jgi:hypothetical protein